MIGNFNLQSIFYANIRTKMVGAPGDLAVMLSEMQPDSFESHQEFTDMIHDEIDSFAQRGVLLEGDFVFVNDLYYL